MKVTSLLPPKLPEMAERRHPDYIKQTYYFEGLQICNVVVEALREAGRNLTVDSFIKALE